MVLTNAAKPQTPDKFLGDAINNALLELAIEAGYTSEYEEVDADDDGQPIYQYLPNESDLCRIAREPITAAALLTDLLDRMGEPTPPYLIDALTDSEPY